MARDPTKETPTGLDSINRHKPTQAYDMKGPGGSSIRKEAAAANYAKDWEKTNSARAAKYANIEKKAIADKNDVREQNRGKLTPEHTKAAEKPIER